MVNSQYITVAAALKGPRMPLVRFVKAIERLPHYKIIDVKYDTNEDVNRVVFKIEVNVISQLKVLTEICCNNLEVDREELFNFGTKKPKIVFGRSIILFILKYRFNLSYSWIAKLFGCNHATIILACRKFKRTDSDITKIKNASLEEAYGVAKRCKVGG